MTILAIRAHRRFAVCRKARVSGAGRRATDGLVIELSRDGCRISHVDPARFAIDQILRIAIEGAAAFDARVRWLGDRTLGLRFVEPLHVPALDRLIRVCRGEGESAAPGRAYGT